MFNIQSSLSYLSLLVLLIITFSCNEEDDLSPIEVFKENIIGNWQSQASEFDDNAQNYGFRTLEITNSRWNIIVERFADEERTIPLFKLEFEGPYVITEASDIVDAAYNGTFSFSKKTLTSFIDPALLGLEVCGIVVNEEFDYSDLDCSWLESIDHCPADYDLISLDNDILTPGKRTSNMCEESGRPTEKGLPMHRI